MGVGALPRSVFTVEALPAGNGDCLLVSCAVPNGTWRLLCDMGPDEAWPALRSRLHALPLDERGERRIDLAIVTHIDHDHIGAAAALFTDNTLGLTFDDVWFNGRHHLERGVAEGEALGALLGAAGRTLPWNRAFGGGAVVTPGQGEVLELPVRDGWPRLTLLAPTPHRLGVLLTAWDRELERFRRRDRDRAADDERSSAFPDLRTLAAHDSTPDTKPANGSSIVLLIEHGGRSLLLAADAFPTVLGSALLGLAERRRLALPVEFDVWKLSHHGSRANIMTELFGVLRAQQYLVSTNNATFRHPSDEALARVVLYGGERPLIAFNYATEYNRRWADPDLQQTYGFTTRFPENGEGITIEISAQA